jgi:cytochrome c-type biogenesis protein CcmH
MAIAPGRADIPAMLGEVMVIRARGSVSPDARALFARAVADDPNQPAARYYLAQAKIADGQVAGGLADWRGLLAALPAADPRRAQLADSIAEVAKTGQLPAVVADNVPPQDVSNAIRGMVDGLAARLQAHPDDPDGWVRLVRAYAVLGDTTRRDAALAQARARYAGHPDILGALDAAARAAPSAAGG